jgi:poly-D-alanine transfer protein DltD
MSFIAVGIVAGVGALASAGVAAHGANKAKKAAEEKERESRAEMERLKQAYSNLDTSNPYKNMENMMEDLTINQKQAQFQKQQFQQTQANTLNKLKQSAGGSGIASVAQALAQQGSLNAQKAAADIGRQEAANEKSRLTQAQQLQAKEREGEVWSRDAKKDLAGTLLGMSQQETAAYGQQASQAEQAKWDAISGGISGVTDAATMAINPPTG